MAEAPSPANAPASGIGRRGFLAGLAGGVGLLAAGGVPRWLGARRHSDLDFQQCLALLHTSLSPGQREAIYLPWDHPSRQVTNTIALFDGPHMGTLLDGEQFELAERLYQTMTSQVGLSALANTVGLEGRLPGCVLTVYGHPERGPVQPMIHGGHLLIRGGGVTPSGSALGGAVAYGQQIGNERFKVEGNAFAFHSDAANRFYRALSESERERAQQATPPHELVVQAQAVGGRFPGVPVASVGAEAREEARRLLETVLSTYPEPERRDALSCVEHNGGAEALSLTFYRDRGFYADGAVYADLSPAERAQRPLPYWQVWRIEGPGTVVHFKGYPHVHAYINIVRDPARQNVGEVLARAESLIEPPAVRELIETALRWETGEALAFYGEDAPARVCPGDVTTGLAWAIDPYANRIATLEIEGAALAEPLRRFIEARKGGVEPGERYRLASIEYTARRSELVGKPARVELGSRYLRDAVTDYLRSQGLRGQASGTAFTRTGARFG